MSEYTPFKMRGFSGFGEGTKGVSPAKAPNVYIDGEDQGTGPEAMKKGIAQEKKNIKVPVGLKGTENLKEVTYDKEDAKTRLKMAKTDPNKKEMIADYQKTGIVKGKGTDRAIAAKSPATFHKKGHNVVRKTTAKQKWQALKETVKHATGGTERGTKLSEMYASYKGRKAAKRGEKGAWYTGPKTGADVDKAQKK